MACEWGALQCLGSSKEDEGEGEGTGDLRSSKGVRSVVIVSDTASVTPVVRIEGLVGSGTESDDGTADRRVREYSTTCVWAYRYEYLIYKN